MSKHSFRIIDGHAVSTASYSTVAGVKVESFADPIGLLRMPPKGKKCPVSGLCRTTLYNLTSGENPPVQTISFGREASGETSGTRRGRFIVARSLFAHLLKSARKVDREKIASALFSSSIGFGQWPGEELTGMASPPELAVSMQCQGPLLAAQAALAQAKGGGFGTDCFNVITEVARALTKAAEKLTPSELAVLGYSLPAAFRCMQAHAEYRDLEVTASAPSQSFVAEIA